jgi:hypothetical protein
MCSPALLKLYNTIYFLLLGQNMLHISLSYIAWSKNPPLYWGLLNILSGQWWILAVHGLINYKDTKTKCRLYWFYKSL